VTDTNLLRQSQIVTSFGPGALVDLPERSVIISGLGTWQGYRRVPVSEPRLQAKLARALSVPTIQFFAPPPTTDNIPQLSSSIGGRIFPTWFVTQEPVAGGGGVHRRRRLVQWSMLGRGQIYTDADETDRRKQRKQTVPIRFVCGCPHGHIDDINWRIFAHRGDTDCTRTLWLEERGTSGDISDIIIGCDCGKERPLYEARVVPTLGTCQGKRPWLGDMARERCTQPNRLLVRTASNAYFPEVINAISLPDEDAELKAVIDRLASDLQDVHNLSDLEGLRRFNKTAKAELEPFNDEDILKAIERHHSGGADQADTGVKVAEFDVLISNRRYIGNDTPESSFYAERLDKTAWNPHGNLLLNAVERVVAVHRLREVLVLVGFTRFEPPAVDVSGELDLQIERANLDTSVSWLPAVENRGEGLFIQFRADAVANWLTREGVEARGLELKEGFTRWKVARPRVAREFPGSAYVLMHSLSHLLLSTIALECGYPASSLRERVYAFDGRFGILIFTATAGADGTLGGLAASGPKMGELLLRAVSSAHLCSNDPICAQHSPAQVHDDRQLHGAACHCCLLIAETSCEQRNDFLDRALVCDTVATTGAGLLPT
jgi:Domain of unknown function (DUF1998)